MKNLMRYTAAAVLTAVCAVAMICVLAYYQEWESVIPASIAMASFMGAVMLTTNDNTKKNGTEKVLPCGDGAE